VAEPTPNPQEALCAEILAEARRESEHIVQAARQEGEALLARTSQAAEHARQQRLEAAGAAAALRREQILAAIPLEANRLRLAAVENQLQSIYEEARRRLQAVRAAAGETPAAAVRETLIGLAAEAISQMSGDVFVVKLSPADHAALAEGMDRGIVERLGAGPSLALTVSVDASLIDAGVIVEDHEGRQVWDNRLPGRLGRMWPELRRQIALGTSLVAENGPAGAGT
jgi:vacuolar-type H+-ATPase subunit E/Vma4